MKRLRGVVIMIVYVCQSERCCEQQSGYNVALERLQNTPCWAPFAKTALRSAPMSKGQLTDCVALISCRIQSFLLHRALVRVYGVIYVLPDPIIWRKRCMLKSNSLK